MNKLHSIDRVLLQITTVALFSDSNSMDKEELTLIDAESLYREANMQAMLSLVHSVLKYHGISNVGYESAYFQKVASNIRVIHEHQELHQLLSTNHIPYVVMKGSASAMYYPEPFLRAMGDVDFLVKGSDLEKAGQALEQAGFVPTEDNEHECHIAYHRNKNGVRSIWEMHWAPGGIPDGVAGELTRQYLADNIETAVPCTIKGTECMVPSPFYHGLIMLLHTASHLINTGVGLRHLCDWAVFADKFSDEEFCEIFEEKLKSIGMWKFAQILTQLSIRYLGMPSKKWCGNSDEEYLESLMCDIFKGGNFGIKDSNRINQAKLITNSHKASVDETNLLIQLFRTMNEKARIAMPIVKKVPVLLPLGWIYSGGRHLIRIQNGTRPKIDVNDMVKGATKRREIYKEFRLFERED